MYGLMTPIEELPEGVTALFHVGSRYFFGYRLDGRYYRHTGEIYTGIVSPCEFRRLTEYEKQNLGRRSKHEMVGRKD